MSLFRLARVGIHLSGFGGVFTVTYSPWGELRSVGGWDGWCVDDMGNSVGGETTMKYGENGPGLSFTQGIT